MFDEWYLWPINREECESSDVILDNNFYRNKLQREIETIARWINSCKTNEQLDICLSAIYRMEERYKKTYGLQMEMATVFLKELFHHTQKTISLCSS